MTQRLSKHLSMRQVAELLGWHSMPDGSASDDEIQRARRRIRRAEQQTGERLLFGGGKRGSRGGGMLWTTWAALRRAGLVDDVAETTDSIAAALAELRQADLMAEERDRALARELATLRSSVAQLKRMADRRL